MHRVKRNAHRGHQQSHRRHHGQRCVRASVGDPGHKSWAGVVWSLGARPPGLPGVDTVRTVLGERLRLRGADDEITGGHAVHARGDTEQRRDGHCHPSVPGTLWRPSSRTCNLAPAPAGFTRARCAARRLLSNRANGANAFETAARQRHSNRDRRSTAILEDCGQPRPRRFRIAQQSPSRRARRMNSIHRSRSIGCVPGLKLAAALN